MHRFFDARLALVDGAIGVEQDEVAAFQRQVDVGGRRAPDAQWHSGRNGDVHGRAPLDDQRRVVPRRRQHEFTGGRAQQAEQPGGDPVEPEQPPAVLKGGDQAGRAVDLPGQGPGRAADVSHHGGPFPVMTGHVPDHKADQVGGQLGQVVEVTATSSPRVAGR